MFSGYRVHSVFTRKGLQVWKLITARMVPWTSETDPLCKYSMQTLSIIYVYYVTLFLVKIFWSCSPKLIPNQEILWSSVVQKNNCNPAQRYVDQSQVAKSSPVFIFSGSDEKNMSRSPAFPMCTYNPAESVVSTSTTFKEVDHHPGTTNKLTSYPMLHPHHSIPVISAGAKTKLQSQVAYNADNKPCEMQPLLCETRSCTTNIAAVGNKLKEPEQSSEGGRISISSAYSQGWVYSHYICLFNMVHSDLHELIVFLIHQLSDTRFGLLMSRLLNFLTQALQSSGVDMSQASIAVQIELGKRTNDRESVPTPAIVVFMFFS